jgi:hypothetical protein
VLVNLTRARVVARQVAYARTFRARLVGLLGRARLTPEEAVVLVPCRSVHTIGMRFPIDIAFLDREGRVVHLVHNLRPFRFTPVIKKACCAVELPAHRLRDTGCSLPTPTQRVWPGPCWKDTKKAQERNPHWKGW